MFLGVDGLLQARAERYGRHRVGQATASTSATEMPVKPSRQPLDWTNARAKAEQANLVATDGNVAEARQELGVAWKAISDMMEPELEQRLDTLHS